MPKARSFFVVVAMLIVSQVIWVFLETSVLADPPKNKTPWTTVQRAVPGPAAKVLTDRYAVHHFYKSEGFGVNGINPDDVTLALHSTVDKMHHLIELAELWMGPMSVAIFAPGSDAAFMDDAIDGLRMCWPALRRVTTFHLIYPISFPPNMSSVGSFVYLSCKDIIRRLRLRRPRPLADNEMDYPHNAMRKVAHKGVLTNFILHLDANMFPTKRLRSRFLDLAKRSQLHHTYR